jgi:transposase-like protein
MTKKRNWTEVQKEAILEEAKQNDIAETLRKHGLYPATFYAWKQKFDQEGAAGLTPQENGHIESFHAIPGAALEGREFEDLGQAEQALKSFYYFYNEQRIHSSICMLPPKIFWQAFERGWVEVVELKKNMKYRLLEKRQELLKKLTFRPCEPEGVCA